MIFEAELTRGSLLIIFLALVAGGFGVPIPEDLVMLTAGALVHRQVNEALPTLLVTMLGVLAGDLALFLTARRLGPLAIQHRFFRKLLPPARREKIEALFQKRGGLAIFVGRHTAGLRAAIFAMAGVHRMKVTRFLLWDAVSLCLSAPLMLTLGYFFSDQLDRVQRGVAHAQHYMLLGVIAAVVGFFLYRIWQTRASKTEERP